MAQRTSKGADRTGVRIGRRGQGVEIRWSHDGKAYSETLDVQPTKSGLEQAAGIRAQRIRDAKAGASAGKSTETFQQAAQRYLNGLRTRRSTRTSYVSGVNRYWMPRLAHKHVVTIERSLLRQIDVETKWPGPVVRNNALIPLRGVFRMLEDDGVLNGNPAERLRPSKRPRALVDPFSAEERDAILARLRGVALAFYGLAFATGARTGELVGLEWPRINFTVTPSKNVVGEMLIDRSRTRRKMEQTKTGNQRIVLLTPEAKAAIEGLASRFQKTWVFTREVGPETGQPFLTEQWLVKAFRAACIAANVRYRRPYNARHTRASLMLMDGVEVAFIATQLGNSVPVLMKNYAKWINGARDRAEMAKLGGTDR